MGLLDIGNGAIDWITRETWDCDAGEFRGGFIAYESNVDGNGRVFLYDVKTRKRKALGAKSGLNSLGSEVFSPDGKRVLLSSSGPTQPNDLHIGAVSGGGLTRVTKSMLAAMDPDDMVEPYLVHYLSRDKLEISAEGACGPGIGAYDVAH